MKLICRMFGLLLLITIRSKAASSFYSIVNGAFYTANTWSAISHAGVAAGSPPCNCGPCGVNGTTNLYITHAVTVNCDLAFSGNPTVTIESGGSLSVTGNANVSGSATFTINPGAVVNVAGNFNVNGGGGSVTVDGVLNVAGDVTINGGFPFCGTGVVNISGALSGSGSPCNTLSIALPVTLLNFTANYLNGRAQLDWTTASEVNNNYFTVEKSIDASVYSELKRINGSGNSSAIHQYSVTDNFPSAGVSYYRLRQTDYDGNSTCYGVITLYITELGKTVTVYPTLINENYFYIDFTGWENESADIFVSDSGGRIIQRKQYPVQSSKEKITWFLPAGVCSNAYFINIVGGEYSKTHRIFISTF
jgi:hypothetical protein